MSTYKSLVMIGTAITIAVSGCAQKGETKSKQYEVQGCATAGLGAGLITYYKNRDDKDAKKKAAIASMMGCMAGAVAGYYIEKRTEEYVDAQDAARSEIARNEKYTEELQQYNAKLAKYIEDYEKQVSDIKDSNLSAQEKMEDLKKAHEIVAKHRTDATDQLRSVEADIAETKKRYNTYQAEATTQDTDKWQANIASYEQEKEILEELLPKVNALYASGATI